MQREINYGYKPDDIKITSCALCGKEISNDEFDFEDYFVLFRGHSKNTFSGYACFSCVKKDDGNQDVRIGDTVLVPEPLEDELYEHEFVGVVFTIVGSNAIVLDQDNICYEIELDRLVRR